MKLPSQSLIQQTQWNNPTLSILLESEEKTFDLPGNIAESLVSSSYDLNEILHLDQTDVEQPTPETPAKDSSQIDVVKPLRDTTPAKTTGEFAGSVRLSVNSFIQQLVPRTINLTVMFTWIKHHHMVWARK